jgi:hypothetical protein
MHTTRIGKISMLTTQPTPSRLYDDASVPYSFNQYKNLPGVSLIKSPMEDERSYAMS